MIRMLQPIWAKSSLIIWLTCTLGSSEAPAAMAKQLPQVLKGQQEAALAETWVRDFERALQEHMIVNSDNGPAGANEVIEVKGDKVEVVEVKDDKVEGANLDDKAKESRRPTCKAEDAGPTRTIRPRWTAGAMRRPTGESYASGECAFCDCQPTWML